MHVLEREYCTFRAVDIVQIFAASLLSLASTRVASTDALPTSIRFRFASLLRGVGCALIMCDRAEKNITDERLPQSEV